MKARNHPVDFTRQAKKLAKHYARYLDALRKEYLRHNPSHQPPPNGGRLDGVVGIPNQEKA